ncbi:MAG: hypothetical protein L3J63_11780 [Geopsychrobacter sp.]|nr:hypothetical protein [Geopsychrobacter sp.]
MSSVEFRITELERKLANLQLIGVIDQLDESNARVKVKCGELVTGWLPWFTRRPGWPGRPCNYTFLGLDKSL